MRARTSLPSVLLRSFISKGGDGQIADTAFAICEVAIGPAQRDTMPGRVRWHLHAVGDNALLQHRASAHHDIVPQDGPLDAGTVLDQCPLPDEPGLDVRP